MNENYNDNSLKGNYHILELWKKLTSLFYSKKDNEAIAHLGTCNHSSGIQIASGINVPDTWQSDVVRYTTPKDGVVYCTWYNSATSDGLNTMVHLSNGNLLVSQNGSVANSGQNMVLEVSKGIDTTISGIRVKNLRAWFHPLIGGGELKNLLEFWRKYSVLGGTI